jgi:hypothetical protein
LYYQSLLMRPLGLMILYSAQDLLRLLIYISDNSCRKRISRLIAYQVIPLLEDYRIVVVLIFILSMRTKNERILDTFH